MVESPTETLVRALVELEAGIVANLERSEQIAARTRWLVERLGAGQSLGELLAEEPQPLIVELLTANLDVLQDLGAEVRAAQAHVLRAEGFTIEQIATLFGVTRQRISALLRQRPGPGVT